MGGNIPGELVCCCPSLLSSLSCVLFKVFLSEDLLYSSPPPPPPSSFSHPLLLQNKPDTLVAWEGQKLERCMWRTAERGQERWWLLLRGQREGNGTFSSSIPGTAAPCFCTFTTSHTASRSRRLLLFFSPSALFSLQSQSDFFCVFVVHNHFCKVAFAQHRC